jgi:hypothetical protein
MAYPARGSDYSWRTAMCGQSFFTILAKVTGYEEKIREGIQFLDQVADAQCMYSHYHVQFFFWQLEMLEMHVQASVICEMNP